MEIPKPGLYSYSKQTTDPPFLNFYGGVILELLKVKRDKKSFAAFTIAAGIIAGAMIYQPKQQTATVNQDSGIYIFTDSRPDAEFEQLATIKPRTVQGSASAGGEIAFCDLTYSQLKDDFIKQVKKKHKDADAIIIYSDGSKADVIKFK